ncbi:lipopolysaccharide biosynthesis protein [Rhabdobacter roseus]|uniref:PST family polysaccharide transporter n=1 Tax=Rhabdobacter roseus TaxID=1655419 RepID=A0A840TNS5_9BACT|nr:lipopolysaccharide biosynthesis protein [Rhabdobacter roseus]MBB5285371.1 PST family polysaccharide transporter [Rhabdobacter roseus]
MQIENERASSASRRLERSIQSGIRWNLVASLLGQAINVVFTLWLSRLLLPKDYGVVAIALAFSSVVDLLGQLGSTAALTQRPTLNDKYYTAAFVIMGITGSTAMLLMWVAAPLVASFYQQAEIQWILYAFALTLPFGLVRSVPVALLQRSLHFNRIAVIDFISTFLSGILAVYLASQGLGWKALVAKSIAFQLIQTISYCFLAWPRFRWELGWAEIKELLRFGIPQSLTQLVLLVGRRIDDVMIGKWIGTTSLGIYSMAYSLYLWPLANIKGRIAQVSFAALTKVQHDPQAISRYYLKLTSLTAYLSFPVIIGFGATSDLVVQLVMGEQWREVVPVLRLLGLASLFEVCISPGSVYQAVGRTDLFFRAMLATRFLTILGILVALPFGLIGVAVSLVVSGMLNFFLFNYFVGQLIPLTNRAVFGAISKSSAFSFILLVAVVGIRYLITSYVADEAELIITVLTGLTTYLTLIYWFDRKLYWRLLIWVRQKKIAGILARTGSPKRRKNQR